MDWKRRELMFSPRITLAKRRAKRLESCREQVRMPSANCVCSISRVKRLISGRVWPFTAGNQLERLPVGTRLAKRLAMSSKSQWRMSPAATTTVEPLT